MNPRKDTRGPVEKHVVQSRIGKLPNTVAESQNTAHRLFIFHAISNAEQRAMCEMKSFTMENEPFAESVMQHLLIPVSYVELLLTRGTF